MVSAARMCLVCKGGRALCGWERCPLLARIELSPVMEKSLGRDFYGPSTSVFVGRVGYPNVSVGPMAALEQENPGALDNPQQWFGMGYKDIIRFRSLMLRSKSRESVHSRSGFVAEMQELAMAEKPTDVEMGFRKKPVYRFDFSEVVQPMGPSASLSRFRLASNPKIPHKVEKVVSDELKAFEASFMLYRRGQDVHRVSAILSSGALGLEQSRKMVPTRYSITAIDDIIFRNMVREVKEFPSVNEFTVFSSSYLSNDFHILLMPGSWEYENFEAWAPGSFWASSLKETDILQEHEPYRGRTTYADKQGGGYYAARLGVIETLHAMRRQARVVGFREISEGYMIPLGVWVVRETVRSAFRNPPKKFSTLKEALEHIGSRLRIPLDSYIKQSRILSQKRLWDFA